EIGRRIAPRQKVELVAAVAGDLRCAQRAAGLARAARLNALRVGKRRMDRKIRPECFRPRTVRRIDGPLEIQCRRFQPIHDQNDGNTLRDPAREWVAQPDARIGALEVLSDGEKAQRATKKRTREETNARKFKTIKPQSVSIPALT